MKSHPMAFDPSAATQGFFVVVEFLGKSCFNGGYPQKLATQKYPCGKMVKLG